MIRAASAAALERTPSGTPSEPGTAELSLALAAIHAVAETGLSFPIDSVEALAAETGASSALRVPVGGGEVHERLDALEARAERIEALIKVRLGL